MYSFETKKELMKRQMIIFGQGDDIPDLLDDLDADTGEGELNEALIDDSLANFIKVLMYGSEDEVLDMVAFTRNKLYQMEILFKFKEEKT